MKIKEVREMGQEGFTDHYQIDLVCEDDFEFTIRIGSKLMWKGKEERDKALEGLERIRQFLEACGL